MYEAERALISHCVLSLQGKGWRDPKAVLELEDDRVWLRFEAKHPISDDWSDKLNTYAVTYQDDLADLREQFDKKWRELVDFEGARNDLFRKHLAKLIELGDKHGMAATMLAALREDIKKLSENILEDKS